MSAVLETLKTLKRRHAMTLGDGITVKRSQSGRYVVETPHGNRRFADPLPVLAILEGKWPCSLCGRALDVEQFDFTIAHGHRYRRSDCKDCQSLRRSGWYQQKKKRKKFKAARAEYMRQWRAENADHYNAWARRNRRIKAWQRLIGREL